MIKILNLFIGVFQDNQGKQAINNYYFQRSLELYMILIKYKDNYYMILFIELESFLNELKKIMIMILK